MLRELNENEMEMVSGGQSSYGSRITSDDASNTHPDGWGGDDHGSAESGSGSGGGSSTPVDEVVVTGTRVTTSVFHFGGLTFSSLAEANHFRDYHFTGTVSAPYEKDGWSYTWDTKSKTYTKSKTLPDGETLTISGILHMS